MTEIRLREGANVEALAKALATLENQPANVENEFHGLHPKDALAKYLGWVDTAADQLGNHLDPATVDEVIHTRHYWALRQMDGGEANVLAQVRRELTARAAALKTLRLDAVNMVHRWHVDGVFVVPDTNALVQTKTLFDEIDWPVALEIDSSVHLVIPMAVIDQLDRLKRSTKQIRSRARQTVKRLEVLVTKPDKRYALKRNTNSGKITTVEVLVDPLGHRRLADSDSEIVDRTLYLSELVRTPYLNGDVRLVTWDGGMRFRAAAIGINVVALPSEYEDVS